MKKCVFLTAVLAFTTASAFGYLGQVLGSFPAPGNDSCGLAVSNSYLYVVCTTYDRVYRCNRTTGSVAGSFMTPLPGLYRGLAYSWGGYLWIGEVVFRCVYKVRSDDGSVYGSWNTERHPSGLAPRATGDGGFGTDVILSTDNGPSYYWRHLPSNGSVISSHPLAVPSFYDCAYDWRNDLIWHGGTDDWVRGYRYYPRAPSIVASFHVTASGPCGLTYSNEMLWVCCYNTPHPHHHIYRIHCPGDFISVAPASLGRVKALFK